MSSYPHMCRDGHAEIGHSDSDNDCCPMCRAIDHLGAVLYSISDMTEGDRNRAINNAAQFYNAARPYNKIEFSR